MTKRSYDDAVTQETSGRISKQAKKEKAIRSAVGNTNGQSIGEVHDTLDTIESDRADRNDAELSKSERKALKRAKKEQQARSKTTADLEEVESVAARAERKALKRAKKQARKAARLNGSISEVARDPVDTSGTTTASASTPELSDVAYREHVELTALPQSEIDAFTSTNPLTVEDPLDQSLRPIVSFEYLPIRDKRQRAAFANFSAPTPVQAACWPYLFAGRDVIGVAETGSGKTLAFGVPCINYISRLDKKASRGIKSCIISPTRELAMQIHEQLAKAAEPFGLKACVVYGGMPKDRQRESLKGTHILVATPGRLNDFIQEGAVDLSHVDYLVLDEADRMLDKGFEQEVRKIISTTPATGRQTLMFTATWPPSVRDLASTFMDSPVKVTIGDNASGELRANTRIDQEIQVIEEMEKQTRLIQLLKQYQSGKNKKDRILVFCLYKKEATRIEEFIRRKGFSVAGIHGDLSQQKRTESLDAFKKGEVSLLVATDVAARGLDIPAVKVVINVTFPLTVEDYVHRIGRTGRAGQDGKAVTLFTQNEKALSGALINVLKAANQPVPEELMKFGTTVKKKTHDAYGAFFKDTGKMKKATKITFD